MVEDSEKEDLCPKRHVHAAEKYIRLDYLTVRIEWAGIRVGNLSAHSARLKNPPATGRQQEMARRLKNSAQITIQIVLESPDEVLILGEAPIVEFPRKKAHEVYKVAKKMHSVVEPDLTEFINFANDKIEGWIEDREINGFH